MQVVVRGYLTVEERELRFIPVRGGGSLRFVGTTAQPWQLHAREITSIEVAVPPVSYAIGRLPHLRIVGSDSKTEWFSTDSCTAYEAADKLSALLGIGSG